MSDTPYTYTAIKAKYGVLVWAAYMTLVECYSRDKSELYENALVEIAVQLGNSANAMRLIDIAHKHAKQAQDEMRGAR